MNKKQRPARSATIKIPFRVASLKNVTNDRGTDLAWLFRRFLAEGDRSSISWSNVKAATCGTVIGSTRSQRPFWVTFRVRQRLRRDSANSESTRQGKIIVANHALGDRSDRRLAEHVSTLRNLRTLHIAMTHMGGVGLDRLTRMDKLHALDLYEVKITGVLPEHAKPNSRLQLLEHLKGMTELLELNLSRTDVTEAGLAHLKGFARLRSLDLAGTHVTDADVKEFRQERPDVTVKY